ncbi:fumarylacetoacetate hydrolase family protein [Corynebacterium hindlerae]|uniref:fumarylacetoacetate hydrolase family protein n=1 Tax=Corynebacterium hindlerae TaxID=699041 RepID=UPI003AAF7DDD
MVNAVALFATEGFGAANLPYGSFSLDGGNTFRLGVRLGDKVIDLGALAATVPGLSQKAQAAVSFHNLDLLLAEGATTWRPVREWIVATVTSDEHADAVTAAAHDIESATFQLAFSPADYVDYYASEHHATNLGKMFRPNEAALKPNWKHLPVGYHGRSSTLVVSGTNITRPKGLRPRGEDAPSFGPSERLDIECELGFVVGGSAPTGEVSVQRAAEEHIFGVFLFNDWSARDIQNYEYVPLGPYLGKSFASTVGTWIVPWDALKDARIAPSERTEPLADYLDDSEAAGGPYGLDITLGVTVNGETVSHPPYGLMYYTAPQMVAHMTVNGATLSPGDTFGSGTVSGFDKNQRGSFIELSWGGKEPLQLADGTEMTFLQDGQVIGLTGTAKGAHDETIDFGDCIGTITPAT